MQVTLNFGAEPIELWWRREVPPDWAAKPVRVQTPEQARWLLRPLLQSASERSRLRLFSSFSSGLGELWRMDDFEMIDAIVHALLDGRIVAFRIERRGPLLIPTQEKEPERPAVVPAAPRKKLLRIRFTHDGGPRAGKPYTLVLDSGVKLEGKTSQDGIAEQEVPFDTRSAVLRFTSSDLGVDEYQIGVALLHDISRSVGLQQRLRNLGFQKELGDVEGLRRAVLGFQRQHNLEETGEVDDATREKLEEVHGS